MDDNPALASKPHGIPMDPAVVARALHVAGFYLTAAWDLWDRFGSADYRWVHAMVVVWALFTVMLFMAEPLFLRRWFIERARRD